MPIRLDTNNESPSPPVTPGSNGHELLVVLLEHPTMGFSPRELAELTDVPHSSIHKTLARLEDKGLVRNIESYWTVTDDIAASGVANLVSLQEIDAEYGDDAYGDDTDWSDVPDLGENA